MGGIFLVKRVKTPKIERKIQQILWKLDKIYSILKEDSNEIEKEVETKVEVDTIEAPVKEQVQDYILIKSLPEKQKKEPSKTLERETIVNIKRNKKEIIKQKIISKCIRNKVTIKEMKISVVEEHKYCSKATFYRYLQELRNEKKIEIISVNNQEYVCPITLQSEENTK